MPCAVVDWQVTSSSAGTMASTCLTVRRFHVWLIIDHMGTFCVEYAHSSHIFVFLRVRQVLGKAFLKSWLKIRALQCGHSLVCHVALRHWMKDEMEHFCTQTVKSAHPKYKKRVTALAHIVSNVKDWGSLVTMCFNTKCLCNRSNIFICFSPHVATLPCEK